MSCRHVAASFITLTLFGATFFAATTLDNTRLVNAVKNHDIATVRALLKQHADPNAADVDGTTPLIWAAHNGDPESGKLLIGAGANVKATNRYGVNALHEAATLGDVAMMEALLKAGADPNATYGAGETPLMLAARTGNLNAVKLLLDRAANVNGAEEFKGYTPLMFAATENQAEVAKLLIEYGADVNARSRRFEFGSLKEAAGGALMERAEGGMTPLQYAAREGNVETGQVLISAGADVNAPEPQHNFTPLLIAIYNGKYDFASMLIERRANVNDGSLYLAIELRNMDIYSNRPNPPETDRTLTATDIIKTLLARGADPNQVFDKKPPQIQTQGTVVSVGQEGAAASEEQPAGTEMIPATISLKSPADAAGLAGSSATVSVVTDTHKDVLAVPVTALLAVPGGYVVQVDRGDRIQAVAVTPGLFDGIKGLVEIRATGLEPGDRVVVAEAGE